MRVASTNWISSFSVPMPCMKRVGVALGAHHGADAGARDDEALRP